MMYDDGVIVLSVQRDLIDGALFVLATCKATNVVVGAFDTVEQADLELGALYSLELSADFEQVNDEDLRASQAHRCA